MECDGSITYDSRSKISFFYSIVGLVIVSSQTDLGLSGGGSRRSVGISHCSSV